MNSIFIQSMLAVLHVAIWHQFILMMLNFSGISDSDAKDQNTNKYHIDLDA